MGALLDIRVPADDRCRLTLVADEAFAYLDLKLDDMDDGIDIPLVSAADAFWLIFLVSGEGCRLSFEGHWGANALGMQEYQGFNVGAGHHRLRVSDSRCRLQGVAIAGQAKALIGNDYGKLQPLALPYDRESSAVPPYLPRCPFNQKASALFERMADIPGDGIARLYACRTLALDLLRLYDTQLREDRTTDDRQGIALFHAAIRHIRAHCLDGGLTPQLVADAVHTSERTLRRVFASRGKKVIEYINFTRLMKARELVLLTDKPLKEIAYTLHYSDVQYFIREYRKTFNIHPKHRMDYMPEGFDGEEE